MKRGSRPTLPPWREGELDIHFINSGRGECTFYILPDGTTLVVDCGEIPEDPTSRWPQVDRKPLSGESAHEVDARYIRHFHPGGPKARLDYMLITHFHCDHAGETSSSGVVAFYDLLPFDRLIDRGYPDYAMAVSMATRVGKVVAYTAFVADKVAKEGLKAERFWIPVLEGIWKASPQTRIYSTNMCPVNFQREDVIRAKEDHGGSAITDERYAAARGRMAAHNGHVVIRVAADGKRYSVFVLDDTDFSYRVLQADGMRLCIQ